MLHSDIRNVKESRKHFEKISDDMDGALVKNAQSLRSRPQDSQDANNVLLHMKSCFSHTALDYVFSVRPLTHFYCHFVHLLLALIARDHCRLVRL